MGNIIILMSKINFGSKITDNYIFIIVITNKMFNNNI